MRILAMYPNADGYGRIATGLSIVMTILKNAGHELDLFDSTFMHSHNSTGSDRLGIGIVKPAVETVGIPDNEIVTWSDGSIDLKFNNLTAEQIEARLVEKIASFKPEMVIVTLLEDNYVFADKLLTVIKSKNPSIPIVVGGAQPTVIPHIMMENPNIDFIIKGEGEEAIVALCEAIEGNRDFTSVGNLFYKEGGKVKSNPLRPYINMDALPMQDLELWDRRHFYKPYDGKMYMTGYFEMSRGCPYPCTYCISRSVGKTLKDAGKYFRRKNPAVGIAEIKHHKEKYDLKRVVFDDLNFMMMSKDVFKKWTTEFRELWLKHINLPYWITGSCETMNRESLQFLADTGCDGIGFGVEAGNEWLRKRILKRSLSNEKIIKVFDLVHEYGIRTTANVMIGFPGEEEQDIFDSIKLMQRIKPDSLSVCITAPYMGTDIHTVSHKLGLIDTMDAPGFKGMCKDISFTNHRNIRNPHIPEERFDELYQSIKRYIDGELEIPKQFNHEKQLVAEEIKIRYPFRYQVAELMSSPMAAASSQSETFIV